MEAQQFQIIEWWKSHRRRYNIALVIAGILGFISYCIVGGILIPTPYFEVTLFTMFFQGIAYLIMMGVANILYTGFMNIDCTLNPRDENSISHKIVYYGFFGISCLLPFSISIILYICYHDGYPQELMNNY
ncbi:MAG: hypothetical protein ACK5M3_04075 [Dysgonomonas sp.]